MEDETKPIRDVDEPLERNRKISAAYADLNARRPDLQWIGLAAIVSRQAGCAMNDANATAQGVFGNIPVIGNSAKTAKEALAETNKLIFSDIFPAVRFYEKFGAEELRRCSASRSDGRKTSDDLLGAIEDIDRGKVRLGSDKIAVYEQEKIVQSQIYSQQKYKDVFEENERAYKYLYGRPFGAKAAQMPLSATCGAADAVPFVGSISNAPDRIKYYEKLMEAYAGKGEQWRAETMRAIAAQGR